MKMCPTQEIKTHLTKKRNSMFIDEKGQYSKAISHFVYINLKSDAVPTKTTEGLFLSGI